METELDRPRPPRPLERHWRAKVDNIRLSWSEYETGKTVLDSLPFKAIIELTQNCNFKCPMCPQSWEEKYKKYDRSLNMPMSTFLRVADMLFPLASFVDLRGFGETTIYPQWPEVVSYLEGFPLIEWHLVTNLSLLRDQTWERMIKIGFVLGFSCDGATPATFERIRSGGKFSRIEHNLAVVRDSIKKYGRGGIYFISTIQGGNIHELRGLVELAHRYSVPEVQFKAVQGGPADSFVTLSQLDPAVIRENVAAAIDASIDLNTPISFNDAEFIRGIDADRLRRMAALREQPRFRNRFRNSVISSFMDTEPGLYSELEKVYDTARVSVHQRCFKPFSYIYVNYLAEAGTCNHMMHPNMLRMGDLNRQTLKEVWNSPGYQDFRAQLVQARPRDSRCQWCFKHRLED